MYVCVHVCVRLQIGDIVLVVGTARLEIGVALNPAAAQRSAHARVEVAAHSMTRVVAHSIWDMDMHQRGGNKGHGNGAYLNAMEPSLVLMDKARTPPSPVASSPTPLQHLCNLIIELQV
jgi:hypothetical protein